MIVRWANHGMKDEPAEYVTKMRSIFDGSILCELESLSRTAPVKDSTEPA